MWRDSKPRKSKPARLMSGHEDEFFGEDYQPDGWPVSAAARRIPGLDRSELVQRLNIELRHDSGSWCPELCPKPTEHLDVDIDRFLLEEVMDLKAPHQHRKRAIERLGGIAQVLRLAACRISGSPLPADVNR